MLHMLLALALSSPPTTSLASTSITLSKAGDAVVTLTVNDSALPPVTTLGVAVEVGGTSTCLVFGTIGHPGYNALLPPFPSGRHEITVQRSPCWTWPASAAAPTLTASAAPDSVVVSHAPALWLRADTIGTSTDLPLVLYAEDLRVDGTGVLRYSFIFSNEDGGTATPALLARW